MTAVPQITPYYGDVIDSARKMALAEHAKHKHGMLPYSYHLTAVVGVVSCFSTDPDVIAAAWLHDVVEDCRPDIDLDVVEYMTNERVRDFVDRLTDPEGPRALVKQISLPRIAACPYASLIKMADRYHNQQSTILEGSRKFARMYAEEFPNFMATFAAEGWSTHPLYGWLMGQYGELLRISKGEEK